MATWLRAHTQTQSTLTASDRGRRSVKQIPVLVATAASLDEVGDGGADDGHLHGVGALLGQRRRDDAGPREGVAAAAREGRGLQRLLLARRVVAPVDPVV